MIAELINQKDDMSCGARLVATDGRVLSLRSAALRVDAKAGVARVVLEQRFANAYAEPLMVRYALPLPHDGVVSTYAFCVADRRIVGEVDRRAAARERFEQALIDGYTAALLEQDRSSLFTQDIGNVPPGVDVVCEIVVDQRLRWLEEGLWEWRFPTVVAPRYLGPEGRVLDAERLTQDVADAPLAIGVSLALTIRDAVPGGARPQSPSHPIATAVECGGFHVTFDAEDARLDRDVVVRWPVAQPGVAVTIDTGRRPTSGSIPNYSSSETRPVRPEEAASFQRPSRRTPAGHIASEISNHSTGGGHTDVAYGLLTLVPPAPTEHSEPLSCDVIVLLDTSGSMSGEPIEQARRLVAALIDTLGDRDRLEMLAFSSTAQRWRPTPVAATDATRREALAWVGGLRASGGTEMRDGIVAALQPQRDDAQRQVVLVTDGLIGFESEVVAAILERLPAHSRLSVVGVGSAVNRTLTASAARAGRGVEVIIGLGENPDPATQRLLARTSHPLVVGLEISGSAVLDHAPARLPDLYAAAPALIALQIRATGGELRVRGSTACGEWEECLQVPSMGAGEGNPALAAVYAREVVEDLEMHHAIEGTAEEIDAQIERIGLEFQIATRLTSWVAISETRTVDPREPVRRERMPQALPYGVSIEGLGLRRPESALLAGVSYSLSCAEVAEDRPSPPMQSRRASTAEPWAPSRRGRVVSRTGRQLVIEFVADGEPEIDWQPTPDVEVIWDNGTLLRAQLDSTRSTRPGVVAAGCTIRVVLALAGDAPSHSVPVRVTVRSGGRAVVIEV